VIESEAGFHNITPTEVQRLCALLGKSVCDVLNTFAELARVQRPK
jgi:hypothetical protein